MNLTKLFETQKQLDDRIYDRFPELRGQDNLSWKILALQVELGECANEWRGFKKWSEDQRPRTSKQTESCRTCTGAGVVIIGRVNRVPVHASCEECEGKGGKFKNPLLEEYVDCLHFILSIGLEVGTEYFSIIESERFEEGDVTHQFLMVLDYATGMKEDDYCSELLTSFVILGRMLGFTWEQIEQAYYDKNEINHERQASGY
ncbi:dUTP diphosphatase [Mammaliicoccus sciuri]